MHAYALQLYTTLLGFVLTLLYLSGQWCEVNLAYVCMCVYVCVYVCVHL